MIEVQNRIPRPDVLLGLLRAENVEPAATSPVFESRLAELLERRAGPLDADEEGVRAAVRDILRNGRYKPTGRSKPASEYLLRAAGPEEGSGFPRINLPVDVCNYVSLKYLLPISLWDLDLAAADAFVFRLGRSGEAYVFNQGGQEIELEDLLVGCRVADDPDGEPIVNPVKDSLATKTTADTRRVAAGIYVPAKVVPLKKLEEICAEFAALLQESGGDVTWAIAGKDEVVHL